MFEGSRGASEEQTIGRRGLGTGTCIAVLLGCLCIVSTFDEVNNFQKGSDNLFVYLKYKIIVSAYWLL